MSKLGNFVGGIADQLRGPYKPHQYGGVILPFTILRRLDCMLAPTRDEVRALAAKHSGGALDVQVKRKTGLGFHNTSAFDFATLLKDPEGHHIQGGSDSTECRRCHCQIWRPRHACAHRLPTHSDRKDSAPSLP